MVPTPPLLAFPEGAARRPRLSGIFTRSRIGSHREGSRIAALRAPSGNAVEAQILSPRLVGALGWREVTIDWLEMRQLPKVLCLLTPLALAACSGTQSDTAALPGGLPAISGATSSPNAALGVADPGPPTQDAATRSSPVVVGRPARVFVFAGFGKNCEPGAPPQITVTAHPQHGEISFVPGQETTVQYSAQGTCAGKRTTGTGVYYTARPGATGTDKFAVVATLPGGETATRSFEVRIEQ